MTTGLFVIGMAGLAILFVRRIVWRMSTRRCEHCQGLGLVVIYNGWWACCPQCDGKGRVPA